MNGVNKNGRLIFRKSVVLPFVCSLKRNHQILYATIETIRTNLYTIFSNACLVGKISLTDNGRILAKKAESIPSEIFAHLPLEPDELVLLQKLTTKMVNNFRHTT